MGGTFVPIAVRRFAMNRVILAEGNTQLTGEKTDGEITTYIFTKTE